MSDYNWKYIKSTGKKEQVYAVLCVGILENQRFSDFNLASHHEIALKTAGKSFENSVDDYLKESKSMIEATWRGEKPVRKITVMKMKDWTALQNKLKKPKKKR